MRQGDFSNMANMNSYYAGHAQTDEPQTINILRPKIDIKQGRTMVKPSLAINFDFRNFTINPLKKLRTIPTHKSYLQVRAIQLGSLPKLKKKILLLTSCQVN